MLEGNLARELEHGPDPSGAPVAGTQPALSTVSADARDVPAANQSSVRVTRRRARAIVWDDGGLKPFRLG